MLAPDELKQLRRIIREEIRAECEGVKNELDALIRTSRMQVQEDIDRVDNRVKNVQILIQRMNNEEPEDELD